MLSPLGFSLLRRLSDGEVHSGEALAAASGISRARVSQLLKEADAAGLSLERTRGHGYRLSDTLPFLERDAIVAALGERAAGLSVEVADILDSTSSELARRAAVSDIDRHLLAAEWQTAGRGRRGRSWIAVIGGSLSFSLGWRFEQGAGFLSGLPLVVGLALARGLEGEGFSGVALKWPNDLVHGAAKVGGILVELSGDALGPSLAIIGVGLNVRLPATLRSEIAQPVTDLATVARGRAIDRNALLARIAAEMATVLEVYAGAGFAPLRAAWQRRHALQKKSVRVLLPDGGTVRGEVVGVDADGALILESSGRRLRFVSGEVSLRRP
ncbi:MAG: biotin--[acetyl-CoA-carboxylase] ligase [Pseudomonadota bacterium]|nr:biotin--[acetyl-CoA-carboxylase] ligase [Pseudomonadota bacterium]